MVVNWKTDADRVDGGNLPMNNVDREKSRIIFFGIRFMVYDVEKLGELAGLFR